MINVAVLYICTGKYKCFFSDFYDSCKQYFLRDVANLKYFVFTDDLTLSNNDDVFIIQKECRGFPLDSLFRFDMFLEIEDKLKDFDYIFFFNANMLLVAPVGSEILPVKEKLVALIHPGYYNKLSFLYPYERCKKSTAYIPPFKNKYKYYMGSFNGGNAVDYLKLIRKCSENIHIDYETGYIAKVHDESHLNKYLSECICLGVSPEYGYPEGWNIPFKPKIIIRDKTKFDLYFNKNRDFSLKGKAMKLFVTLWRIIEWYI